MTAVRHALIMAAGRGQRMMPLTQIFPKAMAPWLNSTLIAKGIEKIKPYIENIHVTVGYKGGMLAQHLIEQGVNSVLNTEGRPNGWWIYNTLMSQLDEPVFVLTCDNVTDLDFASLAEDYFNLGEPACLLVPAIPVPGVDGDYIFHDGPVVTALERSVPAATYGSGIQVLNPRKIAELTSGAGDGDFNALWHELIDQQQLFVSSILPRKWFSIDTLEDLKTFAEALGSE